ncbi:uncharacterized protein LY89DRAFT_24242 [Mollisia scopiformis]|uniref:Uncharacterized protein n=1 Tax=Mollisia scopiformis TaxID=149040 RepID=A0A194XWV7_MOLSC|nr:uncharacterized protein LY89DRAFT_24242 [Mollisia scopiformis]KUJ24534.1 hypothetical protein LY89DRAFT_24242 [Mollisia scopiformis]
MSFHPIIGKNLTSREEVCSRCEFGNQPRQTRQKKVRAHVILADWCLQGHLEPHRHCGWFLFSVIGVVVSWHFSGSAGLELAHVQFKHSKNDREPALVAMSHAVERIRRFIYNRSTRIAEMANDSNLLENGCRNYNYEKRKEVEQDLCDDGNEAKSMVIFSKEGKISLASRLSARHQEKEETFPDHIRRFGGFENPDIIWR